MAITLKPVILKHQKREDGTFNVKIRVTLNRKVGYMPTEHYLGVKQLSKDLKEIKDSFINDELTLELVRLRKEISKLGARVNNYTVKQLSDHLQEKRNPSNTNEEIDFLAFTYGKVEELKSVGRTGIASTYQAAANNLKAYIKRDSIDIKEITVRFLRKYETHLRSLDNMGSRGIESNLAAIRAIFNYARDEYNDEDMDDVKIAHYPFAKFKIPKSEEPQKRSISLEDIVKMQTYNYTPKSKFESTKEISRAELARDVYLISFYLVGMNSIDIFNIDSIEDNRIVYNRTKTKDRRQDKAKISIKVEKEVLPLIEKYKDESGERLFNFHKRYSNERTFNSNLNIGLKDVGKFIGVDDLTFYSARHSWATIARNRCKISKDDIAMALNHTDESRKTTDFYIDEDWSIIDKANRKVLNLLKKQKS